MFSKLFTILNMDAISAIIQLGVGGTAVFFYLMARKDYRDAKEILDARDKAKDEYIQQISSKLILIVENNTKVSTELIGSTRTNSEATDRLNQTITTFINRN